MADKKELQLHQNIKNGKWKIKTVSEDDKIHTAQYYRVFRLVFNEHNKHQINWFICSRCHVLIHHNLSANGSKKLRRHQCFRDYLREQEEEIQVDEVEDEIETSNEDAADDESDDVERDEAGNLYFSADLLDEDDDDDNEENGSEFSCRSNQNDNDKDDHDNSENFSENSGRSLNFEVDDDNDIASFQSNDDNGCDENVDTPDGLSWDNPQDLPKLYAGMFKEMSDLFVSCHPFTKADIQSIWPAVINYDGMYDTYAFLFFNFIACQLNFDCFYLSFSGKHSLMASKTSHEMKRIKFLTSAPKLSFRRKHRQKKVAKIAQLHPARAKIVEKPANR